MGTVGDLLKRSGFYLIASVGTLIAGLISFPLFTRIFDKADYGVMSLTVTILLAGVATTKLGLQQSVIRLWTQKEGEHGALVRTFAVTQAALGLAVAGLIAIVALSLGFLLPHGLAIPLAVAASLVPIRALYSLVQSLLRTRDKSVSYVVIAMANQFGGLGLAILAVVVLDLGLPGFYGAFILAEGSTVVIALIIAGRGAGVWRSAFSKKLLWEGVHFGFPLIIFEIGVVLLHSGDRFILESYWDLETVGAYAVAFNLAWQVQSLLALPLDLAATPLLARIYDKEGPEKAAEFLARATRAFWTIAAPVVAGLYAVGEDLMLILAGPKYQDASHLLPILIAGFLVFSSRILLAAGLFLAKRTMWMATLAAAGAILNIGFNLAMVPRWGAEGSAAATLIAQVLLIAMLTWAARSVLKFDIGLFALVRACAGAALMALAVRALPLSHETAHAGQAAIRLAVRVAVGAAVYAAWVLLTDSEVRGVLGRVLGRRTA